MSARRSTSLLARVQDTCQCSNRLLQRRSNRSAPSIPCIPLRSFSATPRTNSQEALTQEPAAVQDERPYVFNVEPTRRTSDHKKEKEPRNAGYRRNIIERPKNIAPTRHRQPYAVNDSTAALDAMYIRLLGSDGHKLLSEDVKWQCVTHKSFDHAMQPYNEKLSFYGRRIAYLYATLAVVKGQQFEWSTVYASNNANPRNLPPYDIKPRDPDQGIKNNLDSVTHASAKEMLKPGGLYQIARTAGLEGCLRWKPRVLHSETASGIESIVTDSMYAILGALALQRGGEVARDIMENRFLRLLNPTLGSPPNSSFLRFRPGKEKP